LIRRRSGVYLVELLVAIVMLVIVVSSFSVLAARTSKDMVNNRMHSVANNLALTKLRELETRPYPLVETTYNTPGPGLGGGAWFAASAPPGAPDTCDCGTAAFTLLPSSDTVIQDGNIFNRYWCISAVQTAGGGGWHSYCVPANDQYKNIRVWVNWSVGASSLTVANESTLTRF